MKRETKAWLEMWARVKGQQFMEPDHARDALDSDARLRAELRRKDKALRGIAKAINTKPSKIDRPALRLWVAIGLNLAALKKPTRKKPRVNEHLCHTSSSDEQVLCDEPTCPRSRNFTRRKR